jgi:U3 small nucleolar RNA-associated protein 23
LTGKDNSDHVIVAAQSFELREKLRKVPGVPIIYLQGQVPLLDDISKASTKAAIEQEVAKNLPTTAERKATLEVVQRMVNAPLPAAVAASFPVKSKAPAPIMKRKMPKAPNPLSCKKAKKPTVAPAAKPAPVVASAAPPAPTAVSAPTPSQPATEIAALSTAPSNPGTLPPVTDSSKKRKADDQSDAESGDEQGAKKKKTRRGRRKISQQREM